MNVKKTDEEIGPLQFSERIQSLDIMRGIVLFGILLMNINGMGLAHAYEDPTVSGGSTGWDLYTWITTNMFFEGTMRALFSLLFGVGMFVLLDRLEKKGAGKTKIVQSKTYDVPNEVVVVPVQKSIGTPVT
ncbi:MAG: hypothetical protein WKF97_22490 [Chitinophagaceae bacterium]